MTTTSEPTPPTAEYLTQRGYTPGAVEGVLYAW